MLKTSEMEAIENDLAEIIENAPKKEPKSLSVTSLKRKDVEAFFGTKPSESQDTSWCDTSTSDFQKPIFLGKVSRPLV